MYIAVDGMTSRRRTQAAKPGSTSGFVPCGSRPRKDRAVRLLALVSIGIGLAVRVASAQPAPPATAPTLTISGYVEAFYQFNFDQPSNLITAYRDFDDRTNSFTIDNAVLDITGLGRCGVDANRLAGRPHGVGVVHRRTDVSRRRPAQVRATPSCGRLIQQAIIGYKIDKLQTEAGVFLSPVGLENLAIEDQWNWSRSTPFFALPYYHAGVRLTYPLSDDAHRCVLRDQRLERRRQPQPVSVLRRRGDVDAREDALDERSCTSAASRTRRTRPKASRGATCSMPRRRGRPRKWSRFAAQADAGFEPNHFGTSRWFDGAAYARVHPAAWLYVAARVDYLSRVRLARCGRRCVALVLSRR